MKRQTVDFATFKENFIDKLEGGYHPVWSALAENDDGEYIKVMKIDLICEWRLSDGKVRFYEVPFETEEQFDQIVEFLRWGIDDLQNVVHESIDELKYAQATGDPDGE